MNALGFRTALKNGFDPHAPLTVISIILLFIFSVVLLAAGGREEHQRPVSEDLLHRVEVSEAGAGALLLGFVVDYGLCFMPRITYQSQQSCTFYVWEGVRRNTRRVKPTPEEEGYVATQDAWNQRRRRRGTSQHKTRETNAGGGGVRRNTRRVKPTPEEEEYVATKDAGGGGVVVLNTTDAIFFRPLALPWRTSGFRREFTEEENTAAIASVV